MGLFRVTARAKEELFALSARPENKGKGIRVHIEGMPHDDKTCWILFDGKSRGVDRIYIEDGLTFIIGPESAWYVKAKELDFEDADHSFYLTPVPGCDCGAYDHEEWAYLDELPPDEEPWEDDEWELIEDEAYEAEEPKRAPRPTGGDRLPRGWRPAP